MCTLFNGTDQGLLSIQAFSHYSLFIHAFFFFFLGGGGGDGGNEAHTPIIVSVIFFMK